MTLSVISLICSAVMFVWCSVNTIKALTQRRELLWWKKAHKELFDRATEESANADVQIKALIRANELMVAENIALKGQVSQQFEQIKEAQYLSLEYKQINKFLAASYPHEIASGAHDHFKTTADVVVHYLKRERTQSGWGQPQQQTQQVPLS